MVKSKINELFNDNKTVYVFDVDGVLAPIEYGEYTHYYYNDEEWAKALINNDFYAQTKPFKVMQNFINKLIIDNVYVVTKVMNEIEYKQKINYLEKNYGIKPANIRRVYSDNEKLTALLEIKKTYSQLEDKYIVMIDDTVNVLNHIMDNSSFSTVHVSSFFNYFSM